MKAVVLAGGLGTRLRPLTALMPKPMVPVMNRPLLEHTLNLLKQHNINEVLFLLYYLPEVIRNHFKDGRQFGMDIDYVVASEDYGTAGAVKQAADRLDDTFFVLSGDGITDIDLTRMLEFHEARDSLATIALSSVQNPSPFGVAMTDEQGRITRFLEKPAWSQVFSDTVNMGIYVLESDVLDHIPADQEVYFAKHIFPGLLQSGQPLTGFIDGCYWKDIGDLKTYLQVHWDALAGKIKLALPPSQNCDARVLIGDGCSISPDTRLDNVVIGDECEVGEYTALSHVVLWDRVAIGKSCNVVKSVIASESVVGDESKIDEYVFMSQRVKVGARCRVNANVRIWPDKSIDVGSIVNASIVWGEAWRRELFSEARVTGLANYEISPELGSKLGAAFGSWLGRDSSLLLSRDSTDAARMIYRAFISGLISTGVHVNTVQVMPIPIVRYTLPSLAEKGGVHMRRSPTGAKDLEILFFDSHGRDLAQSSARAIERMFFREDFLRVGIDDVGKISYPVRVAESYVQALLSHIDIKTVQAAKFRIVIDYSYGAATAVFPAVLGRSGCDVISLNAHPDQTRLSRTPQEVEHALKQLGQIVRSTHAHAGFLFDPGAERLRVVDHLGNVISGPRLAVLVAKLCLDFESPRKIAAPISIPAQVAEMARTQDVDVMVTSEDSSALIDATRDPSLDLALSGNGGFIFARFHFAFDAMYSLIKLLELLARAGTNIASLDKDVPVRPYRKVNAPCPWESKGRVMRSMTEYSEGMQRVLLDGVKLLFDDSWVLVIADRDKPLCQIIVEAETAKRAEQLLTEYQNKVVGWIQS